MLQTEEQDKTSEELSEMETGNILKKEIRVMIAKMIKELKKRMHAQREKLKVFTRHYKEQPERKNTTEMKNTLEGIKSGLNDTK